MIKKTTGFGSGGTLLRSGHGLPCSVTEDVPEFFVETERHLCGYDQHGELMRYSDDSPYLFFFLCNKAFTGGQVDHDALLYAH